MLSRIRSSVVFSMSGCLEGVLSLLPVARAQLVGLQRIQYAQHFRRVAAYRKIGDVNETDHTLRVDHEGGALGDAGLAIENTQGVAELALDVRQHRKRQIAQLFLFLAPRQVHVLVVGADAEHLRAAVAELAIELAESRNLGRAHEGEILGPEKHDLPFAGLVGAAELLERIAGVIRHHTGQRIRGKLLSYT